MRNCEFCSEIQTGFLKIGESEFGRRILNESDNFIVLPCLGQFIEGYLLIISKKHYQSMSQIPHALFSELDEVLERVKRVLQSNYGKSFFFEHGDVCNEKKAGSCIDHAHIHVIPVKSNILEYLSYSFSHQEITALTEIKNQYRKKAPYFFLQQHNDKRYVFKIKQQVPSQFIRRIITLEMGIPDTKKRLLAR